MRTFIPDIRKIRRSWFEVDASSASLGRLASAVANVLRGKHKPTYTPHLDTGDCVIVYNCKNLRVTGNKMEGKAYYRHTGYIGHMRKFLLKDMLKRDPRRVVMLAIKGMMPKNRLSRNMMKKLRLCVDEVHGHHAQKPTKLEISS